MQMDAQVAGGLNGTNRPRPLDASAREPMSARSVEVSLLISGFRCKAVLQRCCLGTRELD